MTLSESVYSAGRRQQSLPDCRMPVRSIPGTKEVFMEEAAKQGVALDFEKLHEDCARLILEKEERDGLPVKPGVHEILEYLYERKIPVALATSSK